MCGCIEGVLSQTCVVEYMGVYSMITEVVCQHLFLDPLKHLSHGTSISDPHHPLCDCLHRSFPDHVDASPREQHGPQ